MRQDQSEVSDRARAQLLALGIPAADHTPQALKGLFPQDLNIGATGLETEELANVLVYLVEKNIIPAPRSGASSVRKVAPGWHFCQFYRDFDQLLHLVAPYVAEGLRNNEGCLWVVPEAVTIDGACDVLAQYVKDVDHYFDSDQLEILSHPNWYLDSLGRLKSFEQIAEALLAKQDLALTRGFRFLRAAGDAGWVSGTQESKDFIDYEMKVNSALGATKVAAVCTYRAAVTADEFVAIVTAHQDALYRSASRDF